jgi:hypothetical protein
MSRILAYFVAPVLLVVLAACGTQGDSTTGAAQSVGREPPQSCPCIYVANLFNKKVNNQDRVTVYPVTASKNAAPIQEILGPATGLDRPTGIAVDQSANIYVSNFGNLYGVHTGSVTAYAAGSTGNASPYMTITSNLYNPLGVAVSPLDGNVYVMSQDVSTDCGGLSVYNFSGKFLGFLSSSCEAGQPAVDSSGNIYVPERYARDYCTSSYLTSAILIYPPGSYGYGMAPRWICGDNTHLLIPQQVAVDTAGNVFAVNWPTNGGQPASVSVYPPGSAGDVAPSQLISGSNTELDYPTGVAVDSNDNIYVTNGNNSILVYAAGASGNVAPMRRIKGRSTGLHHPKSIAIR